LIEVHLYGDLRRLAAQSGVHRPSTVSVDLSEATVAEVLAALGLDRGAVGNVFINGRYHAAPFDQVVRAGDRLGVFPVNMRMLYA
jgi:hypothetical protein